MEAAPAPPDGLVAEAESITVRRAGLPAVVEIRLPETYDYAAYDLDFGRWRALGAVRADGGDLPASGAASLYLPTGAQGPAFLIGEIANNQYPATVPVYKCPQLRVLVVSARKNRLHD